MGKPTQPEPVSVRWQPDEALIAAALDGRVTITDVTTLERGWLIAKMTEHLVTDDIAAKLKCSRRLVQQIRCEPSAELSRLLDAAAKRYDREVPKLRRQLEVKDAEITRLRGELERVQQQRWRLVDQLRDSLRGSMSPSASPNRRASSTSSA